MLWRGNSMRERTQPYVINNGMLTALRYRDDFLDPIVRTYAGAIGPDFILMDDNARLHRAGIIDQYLETMTIK